MTDSYRPAFVDEIPDILVPDTLYICIPYATAVHLCACECGNEVVTPLTPVDWRLSFNGRVSLSPSIGNWSFACRSHYWIIDEGIRWSTEWDAQQIERNRDHDRRAKAEYFLESHEAEQADAVSKPRRRRWWSRARRHE